MICDLHTGLEDDSEWELVGFFSDGAMASSRRYVLEESGITSLVVENEDEAVELYVPNEEREDAYAALSMSADDEYSCKECQIQFSRDMETCPVCGAKPTDNDEANHVYD
jgi:rubrerythrin